VTLSLLYAACDVFLTPTIQDNLPLTVMESLSSGTPVVAFRLGGLPDMVVHKKNGYLSPTMDTHDLGTGLKWVLEDFDRWQNLSIEARRTAEIRFSAKSVTGKYIRKYEALRRH
jgi:glycosyltransferase involved in cell wall biosynthesis